MVEASRRTAVISYAWSVGIVFCASSFPLIVRFVREGVGVTFAYAAVANGQKDIAFFHLEGMPENREFNVVYLKGTHVQRLVRDVLGAAP